MDAMSETPDRPRWLWPAIIAFAAILAAILIVRAAAEDNKLPPATGQQSGCIQKFVRTLDDPPDGWSAWYTWGGVVVDDGRDRGPGPHNQIPAGEAGHREFEYRDWPCPDTTTTTAPETSTTWPDTTTTSTATPTTAPGTSTTSTTSVTTTTVPPSTYTSSPTTSSPPTTPPPSTTGPPPTSNTTTPPATTQVSTTLPSTVTVPPTTRPTLPVLR